MSFLFAVLQYLCSAIDFTAVKYEVETGKRVSVKLSWDSDSATSYYRVFQRSKDNEWQSISTFDDSSSKHLIRVLNAYPVLESGAYRTYKSDFVYSDGTTAYIEQSSSLKVWMEGGQIEEETFTGYGKNQTTGELFITVDLIPIDDLDLNPSLIWNYDVVAFGSWDGNGANNYPTPTHNFPKESLLNELTEYLSLGYSVIASHDTIGRFSGKEYGLGVLASKFGIKVGGRDTGVDKDSQGTLMTENWIYWGEQAEIVRKGHIVDFPWRITEDYIPTRLTHTYGNIATRDVWMRIVPLQDPNASDMQHTEFVYSVSDGEDILYYLTTTNNTAMIQTGHRQCRASEEERKVWANLIVSLKQRTASTSITDHSCVDEDAPHPPVCSCSVHGDRYSLDCTANDSETSYHYFVEGYDYNGNMVAKSSTVSVDASSGIDHFMYHVDTESYITQDELLAKNVTFGAGERLTGVYQRGLNFHVLAVDKSGNPSDVMTYPLHKCYFHTLDDFSVRTRWPSLSMQMCVEWCMYMMTLFGN